MTNNTFLFFSLIVFHMKTFMFNQITNQINVLNSLTQLLGNFYSQQTNIVLYNFIINIQIPCNTMIFDS